MKVSHTVKGESVITGGRVKPGGNGGDGRPIALGHGHEGAD